MARPRKKGSSRTAAKKSRARTKKGAKRGARKTARKSTRRGAARKGARKTTRRGAARKGARKATRKKTARKAARKGARKAARKKTARKAAKKAGRRSSGRRGGGAAFMKPVQPSAQLAAIVGDSPLPRTEITKRVWSYIRNRGLQDQTNRRMINADDRLREVFGGRRQVSMFEMTKLINNHLS